MKLLNYIVFFSLTFFLSQMVVAQNEIAFDLNVSKNKLEVGEPFEVSLKLTYSSENLNGFPKEAILFPVVTDSTKIPALDIWNVSPAIDTSEEDNMGNFSFVYQQNFIAAAFDTGTVEIAPFYAVIDRDTVFSNAASLLVSFVPIDKEADFKDIKGIEEDPLSFFEKVKLWLKENWKWLTFVLLLITGAIVYYIFRKNKTNTETEKPKIPTPERLLYRLNEIDQAKLWQNNQIKQYYSEITEVIDEYLNYRFTIPTFEKTSHEIISALKMKSIDQIDIEQLDRLFFLSDMVKFAKTLPTAEENKEGLIIARELIKKYKSIPQNNTDKE